MNTINSLGMNHLGSASCFMNLSFCGFLAQNIFLCELLKERLERCGDVFTPRFVLQVLWKHSRTCLHNLLINIKEWYIWLWNDPGLVWQVEKRSIFSSLVCITELLISFLRQSCCKSSFLFLSPTWQMWYLAIMTPTVSLSLFNLQLSLHWASCMFTLWRWWGLDRSYLTSS